ncbi:disease resistance protein RPM1 [Ziziphus jujuba]|uniref:Disease resistance protein RPM1 n=1 Tax=Ziziphus jujuba TaxID=326968 RepID=A0A6P4A172_ZIZJJ|nr:disease resistance protein RPM1 [Ziziphus jujuba]
MDLLIGKVVSILENEASLILGLRDDLEEIQQELVSMKSFLEDTEIQKELSEVDKVCMASIRDLVYKVGDTIDEFSYHANHHRGGGRIMGFLHHIIYFPENLWMKHQIGTKLREIKKKVKDIADRRQRYAVNRREGKSPYEHSDKWVQNHAESSLFIEKEEIVGIERKKTELMGSLMDGNPRQIAVSLIGMGGSGKTTLAASIYRDESIKRYFHCHAWITVSQTYVIEDLLRSLITEFHQSRKEEVTVDLKAKSYRDLVDMLLNYLKTKRYLVVLDDVWDTNLWTAIRVSFPDREMGSRIVLTTRKEDVALSSSGGGSRIHRIQPLLPNDAWKLFCMKAFSSYPDNSCPEEFKKIASELLDKCEGLPLAIVALGGIMSSKNSIIEWRKVCKNLNWQLNDDPNLEKANKILLLSFNDLPYQLKPCFLYCSLFPEDYLMRRKRLIRLWMAEGFVEQVRGLTPEEVADSYLMKLVSRSMLVVVERNPSGRPKACKMHDLLRELAVSVSEREKFGAIYDGSENMEKCEARRLSIIQTDNEIQSWNGVSQLRTLLVFVPLFSKLKLPLGFKLLRVLDLEGGFPIEKLPDELVYLFNLRYLNLGETSVHKLPKSIGRLRNLQTLIIRDTNIVTLPKGIAKLQNLRHLLMYHYCQEDGFGFRYVRGTQAPSKITKLKMLQVLSCIISEGDLIQQIGNMTQLTRLGITDVKGSDEMDLCVSLEKLRLLHYLFLMVIDEEETLRLDAISSPPPLLQVLILTGKLEKVPRWISSLHNLVSLFLHWSRLVEDLLPHIARLPTLGDLCLINAYVRETMYFHEGFLKLTRLTLVNLPQLHFISIGRGVMPALQVLFLAECSKLKTLPMGIEDLSNLQELKLGSMPMELIESIRVGGVDRSKVQRIPNIQHYFGKMHESLSEWND